MRGAAGFRRVRGGWRRSGLTTRPFGATVDMRISLQGRFTAGVGSSSPHPSLCVRRPILPTVGAESTKHPRLASSTKHQCLACRCGGVDSSEGKPMVAVAKRKNEKTGFGARLRAIREASGLTQEQVAERSGMAYQAIARIERGDVDNPTWKTVQKLAEALGVKPNDFIEESADKPADPTPPAPKRRPKK